MKTCDMLIKNCKEIVISKDTPVRGGSDMTLTVLNNADIAIANGVITEIGVNLAYTAHEVIDGSTNVVMPGFIDSHTHVVFGGNRENEFLMRIRGESYEAIAKAGGGIKNTVNNTRAQSEDELFASAEDRLLRMFACGTTSIEAKSGYGLDFDTELKMLSVIGRLQKKYPDTIKATFMGPHEIPKETTEREYITFVINEVLPAVKKQGIAEFADIFTEKGVFSLEETERYLLAAREQGFKLKMHADELYPLGGAALGARLGVVSVDHLMKITDDGLNALGKSETVATLLPGTSFFLMMKDYAPAREILKHGAYVALASDLNPGSCHGFNMQMIITLAALNLKMEIEEILHAIGVNAAKAAGFTDRGVIAVGKKADLILLDIPNYKYLVYRFGMNAVQKVIKNGKLIVENNTVLHE